MRHILAGHPLGIWLAIFALLTRGSASGTSTPR